MSVARQPRCGRDKRTDSDYREAARDELHARTLECKRCGWPVDWASAKRRMDERQPPQIKKGDGCLGPRCGARKHKPGAAARRRAMNKRCAELENGSRRLLAWTDGPDDTEANGSMGTAAGSHGDDDCTRTERARHLTETRTGDSAASPNAPYPRPSPHGRTSLPGVGTPHHPVPPRLRAEHEQRRTLNGVRA